MPKTILIIGAGPGIGFATAQRFAREGFDVVLAARNVQRLAPLAGELGGYGTRVHIEKLDAASPSDVQQLVDRHGDDLRVLHYNAGALHRDASGAVILKPLQQIGADAIASDIGVNLTGALVAMGAAVRHMVKRREGTILLTGGGLAVDPHYELMPLSTGKAGIRAAAQGLFLPLQAEGIHVATVTVSAGVGARSEEARQIAEAFWQLHAQPQDAWTWEVKYP